ncbi:MAG TPA: GNAT family N-acetyltransferase [Dehalococcoidia bacterium]|nr:GNAT family N-acetyltransferase [Dehalococcoidia bacterium]
MSVDDVDGLLGFFLRVPEDERFFLKEDVSSRAVAENWAGHLDYDRALPLLALDDGRIIADAVLLRHRGNARSHVGEIRIVVDPFYRGQGVGVALMRELADIAYDAELEFILFELVTDVEEPAIQAARSLGALDAGRIEGAARDPRGHQHDVAFLKLPLGKWWEWSRF